MKTCERCGGCSVETTGYGPEVYLICDNCNYTYPLDEENTDANEITEAACLPSREQAKDSCGVREGDAEGCQATEEGIPAEDVEVHYFEWLRKNQSAEKRQE